MRNAYKFHKLLKLFFIFLLQVVIYGVNTYLWQQIKESLFFKRNISKLSDEELLMHYVKSGDTEYFGELYNRYIPLLYGLCLKYLQDVDRAQEAVMQLFEDLIPKLSQYEIKAFKPWLYRVAKNHCLQLLRKDNKEIPLDYTINVMESDEFLHL